MDAIKRRKSNIWKLETIFEDEDKDKEKFQREMWTEVSSYNSSLGFTIKYRCKFFPNCACLLLKRLCSNSKKTEIYSNGNIHNDVRESKLPKQAMDRIFSNNNKIKPYFMGEELKKDNITIKRKQIYNYIYRKKKKINPEPMNIGDVNNWIAGRLNIPETNNMNEPFVLVNGTEGNNIVIILTTRMLLKSIKYGSCIHVDGTYKLNNLSYPLLVAGVSNLSRSFFPSLYMITTSEATVDYKMLLNGFIKGCKLQNTCNVDIKWVMADAAEAITNAVSATFGCDVQRGVCFFHLMFNVKKKLRVIKNKRMKEKIMKYIRNIQLSTSESEFDNALILFSEKLLTYNSEEINEFLEYFV